MKYFNKRLFSYLFGDLSIKKILFLIILCSTTIIGKAQVGINTVSPNATLDIVSTASMLDNDGLLIPRVVELSSTETASQDGMLVFLTADWFDGVSTYSRGFYFWDNSISGWSQFITTVNEKSFEFGDVKTGFQTADHNGWYLLDGRNVASLPTNAQTTAILLGFATNLPDASNKILKQDGSPGTSGGNVGNNVTIVQANLPNVSFVGNTNSEGDHTHSGSTSSDGNHTHTAGVSSVPNHNHSFYTANNDINSPDSQGYPAGDSHTAFRTTNRRQRSENNNTIQPSGTHTHTVSLSPAGEHLHTLAIDNAGSHNHTASVNSGGSGTAIDITPEYLGVSMFVYLGL